MKENTENIVYIAPDWKIDSMTKDIINKFTKNEIVLDIQSIQSTLNSIPSIKYMGPDGKLSSKPNSIFAKFAIKSISAFLKNDLARMLAAFYADERNIALIEGNWSDAKIELIKTAALNGVVNERQIQAGLGPKINNKSGYYYRTYSRLTDLWPESSPLEIWIEYGRVTKIGYLTDYSNKIYARLPFDEHKRFFADIFPHVREALSVTKETPEVEGGVYVNLEGKIGGAVNYLLQSYQTGVLEAGSTTLLKKGGVKLLHEAPIDMTPLTTADGFSEKYHYLFLDILAVKFLAAVSNYYRISNDTTPLKIVELLWRNLSRVVHPQELDVILPHIASFKKTDIEKFKTFQYVNSLQERLASAGDGWIETEALKHKVYYDCISRGYPLLMSFGISNGGYYSDFTARKVEPETMNSDIMYPFINGIIASMVALGALECIMTPAGDDAFSYFDGISHIRLTDLGRFLFGVKPDYKLKTNDNYTHAYELVNGPLLVYSRKEGNPYDNWLAEIADKQGNYWVVTTRSFVSKCKDAEEVTDRINMFYDVICAEPGSEWVRFFNTLETNNENGIEPYAGERMLLYEINPQNRDLQNLLMTPHIAKLFLRVEGYRILVPQSNIEELKKRLREHGFIL